MRSKRAATRLIGGVLSENREKAVKASPVTYVTGDDPPFLIMHGTEDPTVPFQQSVILAEAMEKAGVEVEFVPIEGAGHGGRQFMAPQMQERIRTFFDRHLKRESDSGSGE